MKQHTFLQPNTAEPYNTNNAWGFGGSRGIQYKFSPDLILKVGRAGTRHCGEFPHTTLWHKDERVLDLSGTGKKQIDRAQQEITKILGEN